MRSMMKLYVKSAWMSISGTKQQILCGYDMVEMRRLKNREEWLKNRMKYIGGSDSAAIIGQNQWKSNIELWMEKTVLDPSKYIERK